MITYLQEIILVSDVICLRQTLKVADTVFNSVMESVCVNFGQEALWVDLSIKVDIVGNIRPHTKIIVRYGDGGPFTKMSRMPRRELSRSSLNLLTEFAMHRTYCSQGHVKLGSVEASDSDSLA